MNYYLLIKIKIEKNFNKRCGKTVNTFLTFNIFLKMKKIVLVCLVALSVSSCTYQDVINYINGTDNNLTEQQRSEVDEKQAQMSATSSTIDIEQFEIERDRGGGRP